MAAIIHAVKHVFTKHPLLSNMLTFGGMYTTAEISQQFILRNFGDVKESYDWNSVRTISIIETGAYGPMLFYWYRALDGFLPGKAPAVVLKKLGLDQFLFTPVLLATFFIGTNTIEGKPANAIIEMKEKYIPTFKVSCCYWLPVQLINFFLLPPPVRVVYVGIGSFIWVNILCVIKRKKIQTSDMKEVEGKL